MGLQTGDRGIKGADRGSIDSGVTDRGIEALKEQTGSIDSGVTDRGI